MIRFPRLRASSLIAVFVSCIGLPGTVKAQDSGAWIEISGYVPSIDTVVTITPTDQLTPPRSIDFENDLGIANREVLPSINAGIWLNSALSLQVDYFSISRSSNHSTDREIEFDGAIFPIRAEIDNRFTSDIYRVTLGYRFLNSENIRAGVELGVHLTDFEVGLAGEAQVSGEMLQVTARRRQLLAPLPTLGLNVEVPISDRFTIAANADYFRLSTSKFKGQMVSLEARAGYAITDNFHAGILWRLVDYEYEFEKNTFSGAVEYRFSGPSVFLRLEL